jgi:nucleoside-diphosphate-sugar epimerase
MRRALVTGAGGFIGSRTLAALVARGFDVHAIGRVARPPADRVTWHAVDLMDADAVHAAVAAIGATHLLHAAWYTEHGRFWASTENLRWEGASRLLGRAFLAAGGRRIVGVGTCAEYGPSDVPCDERATPLVPSTLYGMRKAATHAALAGMAAEHGATLAWARIFHLYGPGEPPARLVPSVIDALLAGRPAETSHGEQVRDFLHVDDVAEALVALTDTTVDGAVNIGSGIPVRLRDVVTEIARQIGRPYLVRLGARPAAPNDPAVLVPRTERLAREVGWFPRITLEAGLAATIAARRAAG